MLIPSIASRPWLAAIGMVGLTIIAFMSLLSPRPGNYPGRFLMKNPEAILSTPTSYYVSCPSSEELPRGIGCEPRDFIFPSPNITDDAIYINLYRASECLIEHIVMPGIAARGRSLRAEQRLGCNGGVLSSFGTTAADGWKALAERSLCVLEEQLYNIVTSCRFSRARGMYLNSSSVLLDRVSSLSRDCPLGLAICAIVKNEAAYIQEWLAFHIYSGVEHFYLYINDDDEDTLGVIQPFIKAGFVTAEKLDGSGAQSKAYSMCLQKVQKAKSAQWISFQDADEFLYCTDHGCMMDLLNTMGDRAALAVNWRTFSPSNHVLQIPKDQLLIESNVHSRHDGDPLGHDRHIKSIVNVAHTLNCGHPHYCEYEEGWSAKNEEGLPVDGPFNEFYSEEKVRMHHYHKRSLQDFLLKRFRGRAGVSDYHFEMSNMLEDYQQVKALHWRNTAGISPAFAPVRHILGLPID